MFVEIALVVLLSAVLGVVMDRLKQPTILAYLLTGVVVASMGILEGKDSLEFLRSLGQIGVVLLLFLVGMELSAPKIRSVGKAAVLVGMGQILFTTAIGWVISMLLGFDAITSLFLSISLAFSSTIIIVKLLSERKELESLHGRIAVGFLLVQDLAAILILVFMSAMGQGNFGWETVGLVLGKAAMLVAIVWVLSVYVLPKVVEYIAPSTELLFLSSVAWGLGIASLMIWEPIGFTLEAGGFLAGISLANTLQHHEILSRLRPLRDFFIMLFFVVLAVELSHTSLEFSWLTVIGLSLFILIGNPLIVILIMKQLGYRSRTSFLVSLSVAQISEFSLIVIALGERMGAVMSGVLGLVTLIAVVTMTVSTYMIWASGKLWKFFSRWAKYMEKKNSKDVVIARERAWKDHIVLIGCDRTGRVLLKYLEKLDKDIVVMDFNPQLVEHLVDKKVAVVYGDLEDVDMYESLALDKASMVISTVVNQEGTMMLMEYMKNHNKKRDTVVIVTSEYPQEAIAYYELGADYVAVPRWVNGIHLGELVKKYVRDGQEALDERANAELRDMQDVKPVT